MFGHVERERSPLSSGPQRQFLPKKEDRTNPQVGRKSAPEKPRARRVTLEAKNRKNTLKIENII